MRRLYFRVPSANTYTDDSLPSNALITAEFQQGHYTTDLGTETEK